MSLKITKKRVCVQLRGTGGEWCAPVKIEADEVDDFKNSPSLELKRDGDVVGRFQRDCVAGWWACDE